MKHALMLIIFVFSITLAQAQSLNFDILSYNALIEPDISNKSVKGKVIVELKSLTSTLTEISLNAGVLEIDKVSEKSFRKSENILIITLEKPAKLNEKRRIEIEYHGIPKFEFAFSLNKIRFIRFSLPANGCLV